jgi:hypothetical protein
VVVVEGEGEDTGEEKRRDGRRVAAAWRGELSGCVWR